MKNNWGSHDLPDYFEQFSERNERLSEAVSRYEICETTAAERESERVMEVLTGAMDAFKEVDVLLSGTREKVNIDPLDKLTISGNVSGVDSLGGLVNLLQEMSKEGYPPNSMPEKIDWSKINAVQAGIYRPGFVTEKWNTLGSNYGKIADRERELRSSGYREETPLTKLLDHEDRFYQQQAKIIASQLT